MLCPVCRAEVTQGPQCRRCRADLGLLFTLEEQRGQALAAARHALARGDTDRALDHAYRALDLRPDGEVRRLLAGIHLVQREFSQALANYRAAHQKMGIPGMS